MAPDRGAEGVLKRFCENQPDIPEKPLSELSRWLGKILKKSGLGGGIRAFSQAVLEHYSETGNEGSLLGSVLVEGRPVGVNRAYRMTVKGGKQILYATSEMKGYKAKIRSATKNKAGITEPVPDPLLLKIDFFFDRAHRSRKGLEGLPFPDLDNCIKPLKDALEGIVYENDTQVQSELVTKHYTEGDPFTIISIFKLSSESIEELKANGDYITKFDKFKDWI